MEDIMKLNITKEDAKFIVKPDEKIVICVIENTQRLFIKFAQENFRIDTDCDYGWSTLHTKANSVLRHKLLMPNKFVGVARCSENDEWNEEIGRVIAFSRAKDNLLKSFFKRAQTYTNYIENGLNDAIDMLNRMGEKFSVNAEKREKYIDSLLGVEEENV